jgi:hypothetical protein
MATTTQSRKQKGRRLQQYIVDKIRELHPSLTERDCSSTPMGVSGDDVQLSEAAAKLFPFSVEAKNTEKLNIWAALEQSESGNRDLTPLVVFKRNRSDVYCAMKFDDLLRILERLDG